MELTAMIILLADDEKKQRRRWICRPEEEGQADCDLGPRGGSVQEADSSTPWHEDPSYDKSYIQGGGTRSGEARVHDSARNIQSIIAGT